MSTDAPAEILRTLLNEQTTLVAQKHVGLVASVLSGPSSATITIGHESVNGNAMTSRTLLPIASVTKTFTALALADAVVSGRLSLDTPLAELIEQTPTHPGGPDITLGHLASHTSGLPRLPRGLRRQALHHRADPYSAFTQADLIAALQAARPRRPGVRVRYSNFGAALLGEALSRHHQLPYGRMIAERVTGPLASKTPLSTSAPIWRTAPPRPTPHAGNPCRHGTSAPWVPPAPCGQPLTTSNATSAHSSAPDLAGCRPRCSWCNSRRRPRTDGCGWDSAGTSPRYGTRATSHLAQRGNGRQLELHRLRARGTAWSGGPE